MSCGVITWDSGAKVKWRLGLGDVCGCEDVYQPDLTLYIVSQLLVNTN